MFIVHLLKLEIFWEIVLIYLCRNQLQLVGAVCLLVSWKVRDHSPITAQRLVEYTDFNVSLDDLLVSKTYRFVFCFVKIRFLVYCPCNIKL